MVVEDLVEDFLECFFGGHVYQVWIQIWTRNHPIRSTPEAAAKRMSTRSDCQTSKWKVFFHAHVANSILAVPEQSQISMITQKWHEMAHVMSCDVMFVRWKKRK